MDKWINMLLMMMMMMKKVIISERWLKTFNWSMVGIVNSLPRELLIQKTTIYYPSVRQSVNHPFLHSFLHSFVILPIHSFVIINSGYQVIVIGDFTPYSEIPIVSSYPHQDWVGIRILFNLENEEWYLGQEK